MKSKTVAMGALAVILATAPISQASAYDGRHHWGHGGPLVGLIALGAAAVVGTAAILTAPINALAEAPQVYAPQQAYYTPAPVAYAPPAYYVQPTYYAQPAYYAPRGYYYR